MTSMSKGSSGIHGVRLHRASGVIELVRTTPTIATLKQPGQPTHDISLPRRSLRDCLAEELRRLDPDSLFGEVIQHGVRQLEKSEAAASSVKGEAQRT
jgi:glucose-6-phosphate dehydrogenase assembly protein OpcA